MRQSQGPENNHLISSRGVNLGSFNVTAANLEAIAIMNAFTSPAVNAAGVTLDYLEIGNEADLYANNGLRPSNYSSSQYVKECVHAARTGARVDSVLGGLCLHRIYRMR